MYTEQMTQALTIVGKLDPVSQGAGTVTIADIDMSKLRRIMFILQVGALGAAGTVDAKLRSAKTSGGAYSDIASSSITQIVTNSNKVVTLEIRQDQMESLQAAGYQYIELSVTVGANAVLISAIALGDSAPQKPAKAQDIAAVAQRLVM